jgi:hypothetical protein
MNMERVYCLLFIMYCAISQNNVTMDYGLWYEII